MFSTGLVMYQLSSARATLFAEHLSAKEVVRLLADPAALAAALPIDPEWPLVDVVR